ncbi:autophagy protein [Coemansia thaxteri]|nr:autophagy protein [Coemansia thaxteri]KAJ2473031.1 autophagy protein [Coemansia sp. RSA 2322]
MPQSAYQCKRCSRQLEFADSAWETTFAKGVGALIETLPPERSNEISALIYAHTTPKEPAEVSRLLSQSFRTDQLVRLPQGASFGSQSATRSMGGSLALVIGSGTRPLTNVDPRRSGADNLHSPPPLDSAAKHQSIDDPIKSPTPVQPEGMHSAGAAAGNASSQSDSFILLSTPQLHPFGQGANDELFSTIDDGYKRPALAAATRSERASAPEVTVVGSGGVADRNADREGGNQSMTSSGRIAPERILPADASGQHDGVSETFAIIGRVMDRLEERSALAHPMCEDCAETMQRLLDREVADCAHEREIAAGIGRTAELVARLAEKQSTHSKEAAQNVAADVLELEQSLRQQSELERTLEETLATLDSQLEGLCTQIAAFDHEAKQLDDLESQYHQELNDHLHVLERCESEQWALDDKYARLAAQLTQLQKTNVYNDVFNISVADGIASINGFRLGGRSSPYNVEWAEINAAWGQALLLLQTVARRLSYDFLDYKLIPMGSFSRVERVSDSTASYELFGSGDMYLGRLFQNRRFDAAMVAYLACLDQIAQVIMSLNPQLRLPYRIEQDKVGGVSIKPQIGGDEAWTNACKNALLDARWALAFASSYAGSAAD